MPIVTIYTPDGKKIRKPIGYVGSQCNTATAPYEARETGTKKTPTPEALQDAGPSGQVQQKQQTGK